MDCYLSNFGVSHILSFLFVNNISFTGDNVFLPMMSIFSDLLYSLLRFFSFISIELNNLGVFVCVILGASLPPGDLDL